VAQQWCKLRVPSRAVWHSSGCEPLRFLRVLNDTTVVTSFSSFCVPVLCGPVPQQWCEPLGFLNFCLCSVALWQLDGLSRSKDLVFLLAATNLPWELDSAMLRRLEKRVRPSHRPHPPLAAPTPRRTYKSCPVFLLKLRGPVSSRMLRRLEKRVRPSRLPPAPLLCCTSPFGLLHSAAGLLQAVVACF